MRRISILGLMVFVSILAVGIAALRYPSALMANGLFTLAVAMLTAAILAAVYCRGGRRAFWVGFAACGWVYMALVFAPWLGDHLRSRLLSTAILDILYMHVVAPEPPRVPTPAPPGMGPGAMAGMPGMGGGMGMGPGPWDQWDSWTAIDRRASSDMGLENLIITSSASFRLTGHCLLALAAASVGGCFTRHLFAAGRQEGGASGAE